MMKVASSEMDPIRGFFKHVCIFDNVKRVIALDFPHNMLLFGTLLSAKPKNVLELGVGTGYVTKSILYALAYNRVGTLTSVDCCLDTGGKQPPLFDELRDMGADIVISTEKDFTFAQQPGTFDFLVSDADHRGAVHYINKTVEMMAPGSIMFFHDTNESRFPGLMKVEGKLRGMGINCHQFKECSREDERCYRGWLMAFKG